MGKKITKAKLEVEYQGVSIRGEVARLGFRVAKTGDNGRVGINNATADQFFCGSRCAVTLKLGDTDQMELPGAERPEITTTVDIKRYSVTPKWFGATLVFAVGEIDVATLSHFSGQTGELVIERTGDAGESDDDGDDDEPEDTSGDVHDEETGELIRRGSAAAVA